MLSRNIRVLLLLAIPLVVALCLYAVIHYSMSCSNDGYNLKEEISKGNLMVIKKAVERYPQLITYQDRTNRHTLLHYAAIYNQYDIAVYLISVGADTQTADIIKFETPLHLAARWSDAKLIELLLHHNANIEQRNVIGRTPIFFAAESGNVNAINVLLKANADINVKDKFGTTPLHIASVKGHLESVRALIAAGAQINSIDVMENSPLFDAVSMNHYEVAEELINKHANINLYSIKDEVAPIHLAVKNGNLQMVKLLVENGADITINSPKYGSPIELAKKNNERNIINYLTSREKRR